MTNDIYQRDAQNYLAVYQRYPLILDRGEGVYLYGQDGRRYLDFLAGIAVNVLGHGYPPLVAAIAAQAGRLIHCSNLYYTAVQAEAAEKLVRLSGLGKAFFANSGAEANEGAIKLARRYGQRQSPDKYHIISATASFHGRTLATLTATGQPKYQQGFGPLPAGFSHVPYGDGAALAAAMNENTCAVLLETVQGEGGVHVPSREYLAQVRALCDSHGALLILDEIQSGVGRCGHFFAYEHFGLRPDIVTLAKGLGGGVPIGAFCARDEVAACFGPGDHGTTFGGNPLACAAANVVLDTVARPDFLNHVKAMGALLRAGLERLQARYPAHIREVRGLGLLLALELTEPGRAIVDDCLREGLIINCTAGQVLRFAPPLIVQREHIEALLEILERVLAGHWQK